MNIHSQKTVRERPKAIFMIWIVFALIAALAAVPARGVAQVPTFNTVIATPTGSQPWQPPRPAAVGDFNGDGKLDALIVDGTASARFMYGNGNGTFSRFDINADQMTTGNMVNLPASLVPYMPKPIDGYILIKAADVNGDGKLDAICATTVHINWGPYSLVTVLINTGNDVNGVPQFSTTNYFLGFYDVRSLTAGDLNGDGRPDFIVGSAYAGLYIYGNNGNGAFTPGQVTSIMPNAGGPAVGAGVITDVNGDGKADFVVTSGQANAIDLFLGNGDGTLQVPVILGPAASCIAVADLNKDGKPDLIEGLADGSVGVYPGNGNGTFGSPVTFPTGATSWPNGFFISDVNGDGNLDVAASLPSIGKVAILTGNGNGTLSSPYLYGSIPSIQDVTLADFTGDGKPEIAAVSANGYGGQNFDVLTNTTVFVPPLPTQTLTILGGSGNAGDFAANVEYYNPATGSWQPAYLCGSHPWGFVNGTNSWINYKPSNFSDPGVGPTTNQTLWYLYRVRFTVPTDAVNPKMTFSLKADNFAQVAINNVMTGGSTQFVNYTNMNNVIVGTADQLNADAVFAQAVHPGENTITLNIGDWGGLNGFNFRIDLSMQSSQPLEIVPVPTNHPPVANAGPNQTVECTSPAGASVTLNGTGSSDPDGNSLTYTWTGPFGAASGSTPTVTLALGIHTITLTVNDGKGGTASAQVVITVRDTTPPAITLNGANPLTLECPAPYNEPRANVSDACDQTPTLVISGSVNAHTPGTYTITYTATDHAGNTATKTRTVVMKDTTPPQVTAALERIHQDEDEDENDDGDNDDDASRFAVRYQATDACDPKPVLTALIEIPTLSNPQVKFKVKDHQRLEIDVQHNRVKVEGPDPRSFWVAVQSAGGIGVSQGQVLGIVQRNAETYEYRFDRTGRLQKVKGAAVTLRCTATDASGNVGTATASPSLATHNDAEGLTLSRLGKDGSSTEEDLTKNNLPREFSLGQNYPNPFNPSTTIQFDLPEPTTVRLSVFDMLGREVTVLVDGEKAAGSHVVRFNAEGLTSGTYIYRIHAGPFTQTRKIMLMK